MEVIVIIDAFRAFTTACYVLEQNPEVYILATKSAVIKREIKNFSYPVLIGKPEIGEDLQYDIPNSPTRVNELTLNGRAVLHRTEAGAKGILAAKKAAVILAASFVNADVTAAYIKTFKNPQVTIMPMGHEGISPSLEDDLCQYYIENLLKGKKVDLTPYFGELKKGAGQYFFMHDQWQYPDEDFDRCLEFGRFNFAIKANVFDDYALLTKV